MISVSDLKYIHLLLILSFGTLQSSWYRQYKFNPILLISLQMLVKLFFSNRIINILYNLKSICSAKYVWKHFEVVSFHLVYPCNRFHRLMGRNRNVRNFWIIIQLCILQTRTESLKPCILSLGVWWSVKLVLQTEMEKLHFRVRPWSLLTILNFSEQEPTDTNGILMSLLLLVAETTKPQLFFWEFF